MYPPPPPTTTTTTNSLVMCTSQYLEDPVWLVQGNGNTHCPNVVLLV